MDREAEWAAAMRAARGGDRHAYERLLRDMACLLRRIVRPRLAQLGLGAHEAEDVVQEVLIALHARRQTWDETRPILPWIRAIARHKVLDAVRRQYRHAPALPIGDWADRLADPLAVQPEPVEPERFLAGLPARQQGVVRALALEGLGTGAVAARFGISEGAVRVALHRALVRIRAAVAAAGPR